MLRHLTSTLPTFKAIEFRPGLNLIVVHTTPGSSTGQTRNSAGKSSAIELIHFMLGSSAGKKSLAQNPALVDSRFFLTFDLGSDIVSVERSGHTPSKVFLLDGSEDHLPVEAATDRASGRPYVSNTDWRRILGHAFFGLPLSTDGSDFTKPYSPTFRSLFSYFARRIGSAGFTHPERHTEDQQRWDYQVALSYLLGADWRIPRDLQLVRDRERSLKELKKAARRGALGDTIATVAELRPQVRRAERAAQALREQLARFEVHPSYQERAAVAAQHRSAMQRLALDIVQLRETLAHYAHAIQAEAAVESASVSDLYRVAGIQLAETTLRRLEEAEAFYASVTRNRRLFLQEQLDMTRRAIAEAERESARHDEQRSAILMELQGTGALEDFVTLQRTLAEREAEAASLQERYKAAEVLEGETAQLDLDRTAIQRRLQQDHAEREATLSDSINLVGDLIDKLYDDREGGFLVEATQNGPEFRISIAGDRLGGGIASMEIFCMDLALAAAASRQWGGPGFLVHDSHLFDGVDSRQVARAIRIGAEHCEALGWQYIVFLNSDVLAGLPFEAGFDPTPAVLPVRLSDETETGGLFGFQF